MVHIAALCLAAHAGAATLPSFETALGEFRRVFLETRAVQKESARVDAAERDARLLTWDAQAHRRTLSSLAARARRHRPPEKGRPASDPSLGSDLRLFSWRLGSHARGAERLEAEIRALPAPEPADPERAAAARRLADSCRWLEFEDDWLETDARLAAWDLRRAGFSFEAWDIESAARRARRSAARSLELARRLAGFSAPEK